MSGMSPGNPRTMSASLDLLKHVLGLNHMKLPISDSQKNGNFIWFNLNLFRLWAHKVENIAVILYSAAVHFICLGS